MAKKKLFLHIGMPKTGSTALQQFLTDNRSQLKQQGFYYPKSPSNTVAQHCLSCIHLKETERYLKNGKKEEKAASAVMRDIKNTQYKKIIISSEPFWKIDPAILLDFFSDFDITLIAYFRLPQDFATSVYQELNKGCRQPGAQSLEDFLTSYPDHFTERYCNRLESWLNLRSELELKIKLFTKNNLKSGNVCCDFLSQLKIESTENFTGFDSKKKSNTSLSAETLAILQNIGKTISSERQRRKLSRYAKHYERTSTDSKKTKISLNHAQAQTIIDHFSPWCERVIKQIDDDYAKYNINKAPKDGNKQLTSNEIDVLTQQYLYSYKRYMKKKRWGWLMKFLT